MENSCERSGRVQALAEAGTEQNSAAAQVFSCADPYTLGSLCNSRSTFGHSLCYTCLRQVQGCRRTDGCVAASDRTVSEPLIRRRL